MLPVTHVLYLAAALFVAGLVALLRGDADALRTETRHRIGHAAVGLGVCLFFLAFARYWGRPQGQGLGAAMVVLLWLRGTASRPGHTPEISAHVEEPGGRA